MSSSSDSDDEEASKLRAAIDPSFSLSSQTGIIYNNGNITTKSKPSVPETKRPTKSKDWDSGHSFETIQLGPEAKCFIAKRLGEALDKQIKISKKTKNNSTSTSYPNNIEAEDDDTNGVYLFSDSPSKFTSTDLIKSQLPSLPAKKSKKSKIKRRKVDNSESSDDESSKLKSVAVSADWVINSKY